LGATVNNSFGSCWNDTYTEWQYRKSLSITNDTGGAISNHQIKIVVHRSSGSDDGEDVYLFDKL